MAMRFGSAPKSNSIVSDGWSAADFATSVDLSTSTSGVVCGARVPSSTASSAGGPTQPAHVACVRIKIGSRRRSVLIDSNSGRRGDARAHRLVVAKRERRAPRPKHRDVRIGSRSK